MEAGRHTTHSPTRPPTHSPSQPSTHHEAPQAQRLCRLDLHIQGLKIIKADPLVIGHNVGSHGGFINDRLQNGQSRQARGHAGEVTEWVSWRSWLPTDTRLQAEQAACRAGAAHR